MYSNDGLHFTTNNLLPSRGVEDVFWVKYASGRACLVRKELKSVSTPSATRTAATNGTRQIVIEAEAQTSVCHAWTIKVKSDSNPSENQQYNFQHSKVVGDPPQTEITQGLANAGGFQITSSEKQFSCWSSSIFFYIINPDGSRTESNRIVVGPPQQPTVTSNPITNSRVIPGQSITMQAAGCLTGYIPVWFSLNLNTNVTTSIGQGNSITVIPTSTDVGNKVVYFASCQLNNTICSGCVSSSLSFTVDPAPCAIQASTTTPTVCDGATIQLNVTKLGATTGTFTESMVWTGPGNFGSTAQNPQFIASSNRNGVYTVQYQRSYNSTPVVTCMTSATVSVKVVPRPTAPTISVDKPNPCNGDVIQLQASNYTGTVLWSNGQTTPTFSTQILQNTSFSATTKDANGCISYPSTSLNLQIPFAPTISASYMGSYVTGNNIAACYGRRYDILASCSAGQAASSYVWSDGIETTSPARNNIPALQNATYKVACKSGSCLSAYSSVLTVSVPALQPQPSLSTYNTTITEGQPVTITAIGTCNSISWNCCGADYYTFSNTGSTLTVSPLTTTTYTANCLDNSGCITGRTSVVVNVTPAPCSLAVSISPAGSPSNCAPINLSATVTGGTATQWQWSKDGVLVSSAQSPSLTASTTGAYSIKVSGGLNNSCTASATAVNVRVLPQPQATASANSPVAINGMLNLSASSAGTDATYTWAGPLSFSSTLQNPSVTNVGIDRSGIYTLTVGRTGCTQTATATTSVTVYATCVLDFKNDPVVDCLPAEGSSPASGKISVKLKGRNASKVVSFNLERQITNASGQTSFVPDSTYWGWQPDSVFVGLKDGVYRISIREMLPGEAGGSANECQGISGTRTLNITCAKPKKQRESNPNCGALPSIDLSNTKPLSHITIGDTLWVGDFKVVISKITASQPTTGTYSGLGIMEIPYLMGTNVIVQLKNAVFNDDGELISGLVETTYDVNATSMLDGTQLAQQVTQFAKDVGEALSDLLNLDITKADKKKIEEMVKLLKEQAAKELPPDLQDSLNQAADAVLQAKNNYDAAPNQAAKDAALQAFATAKQQLTQVNANRDAFLNQYANIVKLALQQLLTENANFTVGQPDLTETTPMSEAQVVEDEVEISLSDVSWLQESEKTQIKNTATTEFQKSKTSLSNLFGRNFKDNNESIKQIATELKKNGKSLSNYIYEALQANVSQTQLVSEAKAVLYAKISEIIINRVYGAKN